MCRALRVLVVAAASALAATGCAPRPAVEPRVSAQQAALLPAAVRADLRRRMRRHAAAMNELTNAVMVYDEAGVTRAVDEVVADPDIVRPLSVHAAALAAELPPLFHELEGELVVNAEALRAAARAHDMEAMTAADASLAWTCARCHAAFDGP